MFVSFVPHNQPQKKNTDTPYSTLLFSNYGQINEKKPYNSALLLNKDRESLGESKNDGFLMVYEIQNMDLSSTGLVSIRV